MTISWEPGTWYNYDDIVEYEGARYKVLEPHWSQSDWTPPTVPYLWGRIVTPFQGGYYGSQGAQQPNDSYHRPDQYAEAPQGEHKTNGLGEHKSHRNWTPPIVPYLGHIQGSEYQRQEPCNPPPGKGGYYGGQGAQQSNDSYRRPGQYAESPQEEGDDKKSPSDDHYKKALEIGGGVLAGATALAGGFYFGRR